jgi:hypothetical protein
MSSMLEQVFFFSFINNGCYEFLVKPIETGGHTHTINSLSRIWTPAGRAGLSVCHFVLGWHNFRRLMTTCPTLAIGRCPTHHLLGVPYGQGLEPPAFRILRIRTIAGTGQFQAVGTPEAHLESWFTGNLCDWSRIDLGGLRILKSRWEALVMIRGRKDRPQLKFQYEYISWSRMREKNGFVSLGWTHKSKTRG